MRVHVELSLSHGMLWVWQFIFFPKSDADILPVRVDVWILVELDKAGNGCVDCMISSHISIFARPPSGAFLRPNDVSRNHILI